MMFISESKPVGLLDESLALLSVLTGNLDSQLSLDDGMIRHGMALTLVEAMNRIRSAMETLKAPDLTEPY